MGSARVRTRIEGPVAAAIIDRSVPDVPCSRPWAFMCVTTGTRPACFPPRTAENFKPAELEQHEVIFLCMHGMEGDETLYCDAACERPAILGEQIRAANCGGALVPLGMARFDDELSSDDAEKLHTFLLDRAWDAYTTQSAHREPAPASN